MMFRWEALLLFGTGKKTVLPPGSIRKYLVGLGMTTEFMDTVCVFTPRHVQGIS